jgi:hypothetical protein
MELLQPLECRIVRVAEGGLSDSQVFQCCSPMGDLCLRRWPRNRYTRERLSWIHHHIEIAARRVLRGDGQRVLPKLVPASNGPFCEPLPGEVWELTEWMPGCADYLEAPSDRRLQAAMGTLRNLHRVWLDASSYDGAATVFDYSPALRDRIAILRTALRRTDRLQRTSSSSPILSFPEMGAQQVEQFVNRTRQHVLQLGPRLLHSAERLGAQKTACCFVLRDIWSEHVLFEGEEVSGIIDFGAARIDEPATDVARLLGSLEPLDRERWLAGWSLYAGGASMDTHVALERVELLDALGCLLSADQWCRWLTEDHIQFSVSFEWQLARWQSFLDRLDHFAWPDFV